MNHHNNSGGGGYSHHRYQPHSPHGGHHRQAFIPQSQPLNGVSNALGLGSESAIAPALELSPVQIQETLPVVIPATAAELVEAAAPAKAGGFSLPNLGELKGFVDRLGGIDGILSSITKVQKVVSSVTQMAPLVKVLMGSFKKDSSTDDDVEEKVVPKRRKRRKPASGTRPTGRKRKTKRRR
ncbi:MAG: hypothetical protein ACE3L7_10000 [Candidatus Pristimantibacillus sp.]